MSKEMTIIALGIWVIIIPYLGVPGSWRTGLLLISGLFIVLVGFLLRAQSLSHSTKHTAHRTFEENTHTSEDQHNHDRKERITSLN